MAACVALVVVAMMPGAGGFTILWCGWDLVMGPGAVVQACPAGYGVGSSSQEQEQDADYGERTQIGLPTKH